MTAKTCEIVTFGSDKFVSVNGWGIGCRNKTELRAAERFVKRFIVLKLNEPISDLAVQLLRQYRMSHGLLVADALIAATAISLGTALVSKNQGDYRFISGLRLLAYPLPWSPQ
ncbi:MAG: PIN domain-containing protein [Dehalococcoidia bacterium]|nr:PIN domain-containing protein [Dehalococcoidia bacterium]